MANTEGMPDEFVESLMTTPMTTAATTTKSSSQRRRRIQERMEIPMSGGRPAAKVVRASRNNKNKLSNPTEIAPQESSAPPSTSQGPQQPLVGNIVEHAPRNINNQSSKTRTSSKAKLSRFAMQQQRNSVNGFPSVHVPLGTFVQNRPKKSSSSSKPPPPPPVQAVQGHRDKDIHNTVPSKETLNQSSYKDAQNMLAQMTREEIRGHQQDLKAALSPDMIAFLKQRGSKKQKQQQAKKTKKTATQIKAPTMVLDLQPPKPDELEEKKRLAKIVSSVKTHQDLDAAYHAEINQVHPLEQSQTKIDDNLTRDNPEMHPPVTSDKDNDFQLACDMLRSTAPRQTLWAARVVSKTLEEYTQQFLFTTTTTNQQQHKKKDWPLVLPVSLRCLLDQPLTTGYVLHTYVLQSLYSLLLLNAHADHIVRMIPSAAATPTDIYQVWFLDDAVPTPRLEIVYSGTTTLQPLTNENATKGAAAYSTQSSSTSAQADGQKFEKDPMWTLLSTMKILPRLAELLLPSSSPSNDDMLPPEAWIAACGILCMLSQRSPGAASAIVHHPTLLRVIVDRALVMTNKVDQKKMDEAIKDGGSGDSDTMIAFCALKLFCTLARQSRVTAQALPVDRILPPFLAMLASNELELRLQQLAVTLWRSILRYGLGLPALSTMMNFAAKHVALPFPSLDDKAQHQRSLSTDYVSAFAQVLECARVARNKASSLSAQSTIIPAESVQILSMVASTYLPSTRRQVLPLFTNHDGDDDDEKECQRYRWNAARLRFLNSFWSLSSEPGKEPIVEEIKVEELTMEDELSCLEGFDIWTDPGGDVERAWKQVVSYVTTAQDVQKRSPSCEAASSAFLQSFVSILLTMEKSRAHAENSMVRELARSVVNKFTERILEGLREATKLQVKKPLSSSRTVPLAERGWINQCHFAVSKLLFHALSTNIIHSSSDIDLLRMLVFSLLGRLQRGDESMAAVLFSQDTLFQPSCGPLQDDTMPSSSPISSMFLGELCGSDRARKQLDQSFKLHHGYGITAEGFGPFALDSLLSDADQPGRSSPTDMVLPVGNLWLYQALSGAIRMKNEVVAKGTMEAANVVSDVLGLLLELEEVELDDSHSGYATRIPLGIKLYYLMNVCLHPETVLRDDRVLDTAEAVFDRYWNRLTQASLFEFSNACFQHTEPAKKAETENEGEELEEKDRKLFELFNPDTPNNVALPSKEMRSLESFLEDLSTAFIDYGAQYNIFTKCMRVFLLPIVPSSIRCRALRDLRGVLHLLTLPSEMEDSNKMSMLLRQNVAGGLPQIDGSLRDPSDVLDGVVSILAQQNTARALDGFMLNYSIALLVRNVATSLSGPGLEASKQRLLRLDKDTVSLVCNIVGHFMIDGGTKEALVKATIQAKPSSISSQNQGSVIAERDLENLLTGLKASSPLSGTPETSER